MKISRNYLKIFSLLFAFFLVFGVISHSLVSYANVYDLMIGTGSNALMTMELDDSDYSVMPMSSVGTVVNTISESQVVIYCTDGSHNYNRILEPQLVNGRFRFNFTMPDGFESYWIRQVDFFVKSSNTGIDALPPSGTYLMGFDFSSDIGFTEPYDVSMFSAFEPVNAQAIGSKYDIENYSFSSGDLYIPPFAVNVRNNVSNLRIMTTYYQSHNLKQFGGNFAFNFTISDASNGVNLAGSNSTINDYESDVSGSLSDLSFSVDTMTDEISGVTEAIQNLQGAMEPHYSNVLTQLHHITEQLHAFYDQVYNNIHLPQLDMLTQIRNAIENIDLQIEVDISEVKTAINNMSTAVQNKLQSTTDQITGGYDNSGMSSDKTELDGVLDQYEQAEEDLFDDAQGHINDFEFNTPLDSFTGPLADVSYFLNGMFEAMGPMNVVISFSLTLTIAMVMIGWYRFKGGR